MMKLAPAPVRAGTGSYKSVQASNVLDADKECKKLTGSEYSLSQKKGWNGQCRTIDRSWDAYDFKLDSDTQVLQYAVPNGFVDDDTGAAGEEGGEAFGAEGGEAADAFLDAGLCADHDSTGSGSALL
eukprot:tig00000796_g4237.t1